MKPQAIRVACLPDNMMVYTNLRVRLPHHYAEKYLLLKDIDFSYGKPQIEAAINENLDRLQLSHQGDATYKEKGVAIFYRFLKDEIGWRIFLSIDMEPPPVITDKRLGVIGVDINADHLAATEINHHGNPVNHWRIPLHLRNKRTEQRQAIMGDAIKELVNIAIETGKPIVKENLNFDKKKAELQKGANPENARMLSALSYSALHEMMASRCFRNGVELFTVNPAYTSIIGRVKFAKRYGLSVHQAAALVIGRRLLGYSEKPSRKSGQCVPIGKGEQVTFSLPVRNVEKHVWSHWAAILRQFKVVLAAHFKAVENRSSSDPPTIGLLNRLNDELPF